MKVGILLLSDHAKEAAYAAITRAHMQLVGFEAGLDGYVLAGALTLEPTARFELLHAMYGVLPVLLAENALGKPILGIGQGAQLLVESGIVPGLENNKVGMGVQVESCEPINMTLCLSPHYQRNVFTQYVTQQDALAATFDEASAQFIMSETLADEITAQGLNVFDMAVANKTGNALAVLPNIFTCDAIFQSMQRSMKQARTVPNNVVPLYYYPRPIKLTNDNKHNAVIAPKEMRAALQVLLKMLDIQLIVSDKLTAHNVVVISTLSPQETPILWCFDGGSAEITSEIQKLLKSNVLYNPYTHQCFSYPAP
jgi:hypothetical protein